MFKCQDKREYHVNECKADISMQIIWAGVIVGLIFSFFLWNYLYALSTASFIIPIFIWQQQQASVKDFNRYKIKELRQPSN